MGMDWYRLLTILFWSLVLLLNGIVLLRLLQSHFGRRRTVKAEVIGRQTVERFSKYTASGKTVRYAVVFLVDGKKKSFFVSEFSYNGYRKGERGQLTYQGDRLIDFH